MNKKHFQLFTQAVGMITLTLFAIYGLLSAVGIVTPSVSAQDAPSVAPENTNVEIVIDEMGDGNLAELTAIQLAEQTGTEVTRHSAESASASLQVPAYFNYQGILREPDGSLTNGTVGVRAVLHTLATGGTVLYVEDFPNINVRDGQFNIVLGENSSYDLLTAFETAPLYMGIFLDADNNGSSYETEILPRERVHGVPWSIYAQNSFDGVPVGGIVDWWRPINDDNLFPIPDGFELCDGHTVTDPESPLNGYALPNMQSKITVGVGNITSVVGLYGGSNDHTHTINSVGNHNHDVFEAEPHPDNPGQIKQYSYDEFGNKYWDRWWVPDGVGYADGGQWYFGGAMNQTTTRIWGTSNNGSHTHTENAQSNYPPYMFTAKLCRTR